MMGLWFRDILLQETKERVGTSHQVVSLARSNDSISCSRGFSGIICRELCGKVGGDGGRGGGGGLGVCFHDSDMCIFSLGSYGC